MPYTAGPFSVNHLYLQWGGTLPGNEQWTCGLRIAGDGSGAIPDETDIALLAIGDLPGGVGGPTIVDLVSGYHSDADVKVSPYAVLTYVKLNAIATTGHYLYPTTNEHVYAPGVQGGGSTSPLHPNQVAWAVSLKTAWARGPAHAGRFYLPMPAVGIDGSSGLVPTTTCTAAATRTLTFVNAINDKVGAVAPGIQVRVMSRKTGAATTHPVSDVNVGRVLDTQRRRRRSLPER